MWNLLLNEDEAMIADSVREYLAAEMPLERLRPKAKPVDTGAAMRGMADLGCFSVGLPGEVGGSELSLVEEMLIQREFARYVISPATLAIVVAGHVCVEAGNTALAAQIGMGKQNVGLALLAANASGNARAMVIDWNPGDPILAWTSAGIGLFPADAFADEGTRPATDDSTTLNAGVLSLDRATHWLPAGSTRLLTDVRVLLAAALCGLAEHATDLTVEYARIREQFGKPIGTFQAVKHRCADMGVRARLAWHQTRLACLKVLADAPDAELNVASALLLAADSAHENGRAAVQMHGGIGFQAECDVHWFVKRTHLYDHLGGGREALTRQVLACPPAE